MFPRIKEVVWEEEDIPIAAPIKLYIERSTYGNYALYSMTARGSRNRLFYLHVAQEYYRGVELSHSYLE